MYVANLYAEGVQCATNSVVGRDAAATGESTSIGLAGGLEMDGSNNLQIADLGVSTAKIAADAVTYAKIQNVGANSFLANTTAASADTTELSLAASQLAGRGSTGNLAAITLGSSLSISTTTLNVSAGSDTQVIFNDGGTAAGDAGLVYNKTTDVLTAGGLTLNGNMNVGANLAYFSEFDNGNSGTADTIDWAANGNKQKSTLTGNVTFTFTAPTGPASLILKLVQDSTGSRLVTWPSTVHWPSGTAPTLTTTADRVDVIMFYFDGTTYFGAFSLNFVA